MSKRDRKKKRQMSNRVKKDIVKAIPEKMFKELPKGGMVVYGVGAHLADMLKWHPDLAFRIVRIIDKNEEKIGHYGRDGCGLRGCPAGGDADRERDKAGGASSQKTAGARTESAQIRQKDAL